MQFDSLAFVVFFLAVICLYRLGVDWSMKKNLLLVASYVFYASWNPWFLPLLILSSVLAWWMALRMSRSSGRARRNWLVAILMVNLGLLAYFKYAFFIAENGFAFLALIGVEGRPPAFSLILPLGISFYTFHSLSYCIDIYRRRFEPVSSLRDYLLYVAFFPQLVAGPIVRWTQIGGQIEAPRAAPWSDVALGVALLIFGVFEKVVLADSLFAPVSDRMFALDQPSGLQAWVGVIAFSGQIFCDFAGYSTCAIGAALALGFRLPINFQNPYAAVGFSDFWRRWHISLSSWLRDYLYISLGGNRGGRLRLYRNLMLTMLIGGLWHGAGWTFVIWGALHGLFLVVERLFRDVDSLIRVLPGKLRNLLGWSITLISVMLAWAWFRSRDLQQGWMLTTKLLQPFGDGVSLGVLDGASKLALVAFAALLVVQVVFRNRTLDVLFQRWSAVWLGLVLGAMMAAVILSPGLGMAFIYFQF